jgi:hypothetical protein
MLACPKVDRRCAEEIAAQVRTLLPVYVPGLQTGGDAGQLVEALTRIFARYGELVIDRLNRAPERNLLAFLNLVGISPQRPQSARVPLTFYLSAQSVFSAVVSARTQVAAELAKGEKKPVLFETENELVVVAARLESLFVKNGERDSYRDWKGVLGPATPPPSGQGAASRGSSTIMAGTGAVGQTQSIPHVMYVGLPFHLNWPDTNLLRLRFLLEQLAVAFPDARSLQWELCENVPPRPAAPNAPEGGSVAAHEEIQVTAISPERDETKDLTNSGEIVFRNLRQPKPAKVEGVLGCWIRCRLLTPITRRTEPVAGMVRETHLLRIKGLTVETEFEQLGLQVEAAFANNAKVDTSKDFFPFGGRPKFGDTLYVASDAFSNPDAFVTIRIDLTNPSDASDSPLPPVAGQGLKLRWEFWDGQEWAVLGTGDLTAPQRVGRVRILRETPGEVSETEFSDTTRAFSDTGTVSFRFSQPPAPCTVNGQKGYWVRVRIIAGDYGRETLYEKDESGAYVLTPASFAPPSIRSIKVDYAVESESQPEAITTCNDFVYRTVQSGESFQPFLPASSEDALPSVYFGFAPPVLPVAGNVAPIVPAGFSRPPFPSRSMSLYVGVNRGGPAREQALGSGQPALVATWEYWNGSAWTKWTVRDDTQGLERSGMIRILMPSDYQLSKEFDVSRYWLRMRRGYSNFDPQLKCVLLNTTMAREGATVLGEILGSSNGRPSQKFRTTQAPILDGQQLEIREPSPPTKEEELAIAAEEGTDSIRRVAALEGRREQIWVRWHEVTNFYCSNPRDRHYVLDWLSGEVLFGDGVNGQIPPAMPGNIRMANYRTGGGAAGNKAALTIKQLKTAVPYIDKVVNWQDAGGGGDAEPASLVVDRGPRVLRHGKRAVTREDFEDLALMASSQVARARCVPLRDLEKGSDARTRQLGVVSIIVVPGSIEPTPMPSSELLDCVRSFLLNSCTPTVRLVLVGPEYLPIDVEAEIAVDDPDTTTEVELSVTLALQNYLHPVTGGRNQAGWEFGREPQKSDLCGIIEDVPGVSHVRNLKVRPRPLPAGEEKTGLFLICAGEHRIVTTLQD